MKSKIIFKILFALMLLKAFPLFAQVEDVEQITIFGSRLKNPVVLDVKKNQDVIDFTVINKSLFLYDFEIKFGEFGNLSPRVFEKKTTLLPGPNRLFSFKIVNPEEPPSMSYKTRYYLSASNTLDQRFDSYLVPIGKNKIVNCQFVQSDSLKRLIINQFSMNQGDTIYSARKGIVTSLPANTVELDRLFNHSIEVRHEDGTVAVYLGADPDQNFIKLGQTIYPGQPIGLVGISKMLIFKVYEIQEEGKVRSINILYSSNDQITDERNIFWKKVSYSPDIIKKEMTRKEIGKFEKGGLY